MQHEIKCVSLQISDFIQDGRAKNKAIAILEYRGKKISFEEQFYSVVEPNIPILLQEIIQEHSKEIKDFIINADKEFSEKALDEKINSIKPPLSASKKMCFCCGKHTAIGTFKILPEIAPAENGTLLCQECHDYFAKPGKIQNEPIPSMQHEFRRHDDREEYLNQFSALEIKENVDGFGNTVFERRPNFNYGYQELKSKSQLKKGSLLRDKKSGSIFTVTDSECMICAKANVEWKGIKNFEDWEIFTEFPAQ